MRAEERERVLLFGLARGISSWAYRVGATSALWAQKGTETGFWEELLWLKIWIPLMPTQHIGLGFCYHYYLITLFFFNIWLLKWQPKWEHRIGDVLSTFIPAGLAVSAWTSFSRIFSMLPHKAYQICHMPYSSPPLWLQSFMYQQYGIVHLRIAERVDFKCSHHAHACVRAHTHTYGNCVTW